MLFSFCWLLVMEEEWTGPELGLLSPLLQRSLISKNTIELFYWDETFPNKNHQFSPRKCSTALFHSRHLQRGHVYFWKTGKWDSNFPSSKYKQKLDAGETQRLQKATPLAESLISLSSLVFLRKAKSASGPPKSPSLSSLSSLAAPAWRHTAPSSAECAQTGGVAPHTEPPPFPWTSSVLMGRSWRRAWCSSRPVPAITTAPETMTSSSHCTTGRCTETWPKARDSETPGHFRPALESIHISFLCTHDFSGTSYLNLCF